VIARKRTQQEVDPFLCGQIGLLLDALAKIRLVVKELERQFIRLAANRDATLAIDRIDGELIGIAVSAPRRGKRAGQLQGGSKGNGIGGMNGRAGRGERQHQRGDQQVPI